MNQRGHQNSRPHHAVGIMCSLKYEGAILELLKTYIFYNIYARHCFAKEKASKQYKKYHNPKTTDRVTKRPQTEQINISLDNWQIHL